ncbi:MAG: hypothetical protein ACREMZ_16380 [Gemmatimonadales bacterium]
MTARRSPGTMQQRFGGVDTPSAIAGMFTALGVLVFVSSLLAVWAGELGYSLNMLDPDGVLQEFEVVAYIVLLAAVFLAFFVGGWAAGRMARIDGGITAVASAVWMLFAIVVFAAVGIFGGAEFNPFSQAGLPDWISQLDSEDITIEAGIATIGTILIMFLASWLGGRAGETYHRDADRMIPARPAEDQTTVPIT